ncbi:MAG: polyprenyl synthetase family protein [Candidatus Latescibacteria bacterium]|nr:polyprenyl synthetase family protein [Candidatus Latescibacterota bacterium]
MNTRLKTYLETNVPLIDKEMFSFLGEGEPLKFLYEPMRDYPIRGGKRFRSALVLLACEALGGEKERALRTAVAFEMFQSFALVHDDIEDGSEMRRGKPCLHHLHGVPLSINVGDALYSKVFEILAANRERLGETITLDLIDEMVRGARKTFEGQAYDIGWIEAGEIPDVDAFVEMLRLKTGWYSGWGPCTAGAIIAGAGPREKEVIGQFGETMAVAFQIRDDLLNLTIKTEDASVAPTTTTGGYGKERGGDIAEGKRTLMVIDLLHRCTPEERARVKAILDGDRSEATSDDIEWTIGLMEQYGSIARAEEACRQRASAAESHLEVIPPSDARETLREMCTFLVEREH